MSTKISWTENTWNPMAGCTMASPGCRNCYAMRMAARLEAMGQAKYEGLTRKSAGRAVWTGKLNLDEKALGVPRKWRKPARVFVNSMSDVFHEDAPDEWIDRIMQVIRETPQHTYQILTKRAARMADYWLTHDCPENVWWGVSAEDNDRAQERIPHLVTMRGATTFVSYEPAIGPIEWQPEWSPLDQIIVGAESGADRRPFRMQWARDARDFCLTYNVAFFFKQQSAFKSGVNPWLVDMDGRRWQWHQWPDDRALPVEVVA